MAHIQIFEELFGNLHGEYEAQSQGTLLIPPPAVLHYPSSFWQNVGRRSEFRSFVGRPRWTASPTSRAPRASNAHSHSALEQEPKTRWLERLCIHLICDFQDSNSMQQIVKLASVNTAEKMRLRSVPKKNESHETHYH